MFRSSKNERSSASVPRSSSGIRSTRNTNVFPANAAASVTGELLDEHRRIDARGDSSDSGLGEAWIEHIRVVSRTGNEMGERFVLVAGRVGQVLGRVPEAITGLAQASREGAPVRRHMTDETIAQHLARVLVLDRGEFPIQHERVRA